MRNSLSRLVVGTVLAVGFAAVAIQAQVTIGITVPNYPLNGAPLLSCDPTSIPDAERITVTGAPAGSNVFVQFIISNPYGGSAVFLPSQNFTGTGGDLSIPIPYPESEFWPYIDPTTNVREILVNVMVAVSYENPDGSKTGVKKTGKGWWIRCAPPERPAEGCTPGYWKQDQHFDSWSGYAPTDDFNTVFGVSASFDPHTLLDAVWLGGGGENALARHAVAALLNASNGAVAYPYTVADVIAMVQEAYSTGNFEPTKNLFDAANNAGCPLN